jgi:hypothetical protein
MLRSSSSAVATAPATAANRRSLLLASVAALAPQLAAPRRAGAAGAVTPPEDNSSSALVQQLLERSNAPGVRERRAKERLDAYNDKIYGEGYFDVEVGQGAAKGRGISDDTAGKIKAWQQAREERLAAGRR